MPIYFLLAVVPGESFELVTKGDMDRNDYALYLQFTVDDIFLQDLLKKLKCAYH